MEKLPSLNGLRAVSIIIVLLFHLLRYTFDVNLDDVFRVPIFNGRFGVNVFFIISGFLITTLLLQEERKTGHISFRKFYIRRTLRIFPAYYFLLLVYLVLQLLNLIEISRAAWITSLTYTKYINYRIEFYTSHAWSLSVEENFYLFWPLIFKAGDKARKRFAALLIVLPIFVRLYINYYPLDWLDEQSVFVRIDAIAIGCLVALYKSEIIAMLESRWNDLFFYCVLLLFLIPWLDRLVENTFLEIIFVCFGVLTGIMANVLIAGILLYSVYGPKGGWYKLLNSKVFNYVGILSYSLYLWQQFFIDKREWWITQFPQNLGCIFLAAIFSHYVIERPFLRLKSKFALSQPGKNVSGYSSPVNKSGRLSRVRAND
jgi:peptidoglycan/LPS O-acetylase OafA/YrhL